MTSKYKPVSVIILCGFLLLSIITACTPDEGEGLQESDIKPNCIFRPIFETAEETLEAGTAFAIRMKESENPIIVTAIHLFGPSGGLEADIPSTELPEYVKKVILYDVFSGDYVGESKQVLLIPEAKPLPELDRDLAAFIAEGLDSLVTAELYDKVVEVGETVWLAGEVLSGDPPGQKLHEAKVIYSTGQELGYKYTNSKIEIRATSGAPILNADGKVVGINIGGYREGNDLIGIANPSISVKQLLINALKSTQ